METSREKFRRRIALCRVYFSRPLYSRGSGVAVSPREILTRRREPSINLPSIPCPGVNIFRRHVEALSLELNSVEWKSAIKQYLREFKRRRKVASFIRGCLLLPPSRPSRTDAVLTRRGGGCVSTIPHRSPVAAIVMRMFLGFLARARGLN